MLRHRLRLTALLAALDSVKLIATNVRKAGINLFGVLTFML